MRPINLPDNMSKYLYSDAATDKDSLGFKHYVNAIAEFLTTKNTKPPITLSIEGPWGCGKSSFMKQLKKEIDKKSEKKNERYFTVWFNCWQYEKEDELWASFALSLMEQLSEQLSWGRRLCAQFNLKRLRLKLKWKSGNSIYFHIVFFIFAVGVFIYSTVKFIDLLFLYSVERPSVNIFVTLAGIIGSTLAILSTGKDIVNVIGNPFDFSKFVSNPNYVEHISFIERFHFDFGKIIESYAGNSRVYVFIDDLDRCEIQKASELMQAINLMISDKVNTYFIIGMDRKVISAGIAAKNEKVIDYLDIDGLRYGHEFIEKFIQLPFKVPTPKREDLLNFLRSSDDEECSKSKQDEDKGKDKEIDVVQYDRIKEKLADSKINNTTELNIQILNNDKDCSEDTKTWIHILEMVAPALDNNPRRIKQFINLFRFQRFIGKNIGLFSYIDVLDTKYIWNCKKLAKFVALSINWPTLISALSLNIRLLDQLENYGLKPEENKKLEENTDLEKWIKDKKLINLLIYGCEEDRKPDTKDEYTLSGLSFSKLLEISPDVTYFDPLTEKINNTELGKESCDGIESNMKLKIRPFLSLDLQEIVDIIRNHGGMISQKEMRSRLDYSEVKASILLAELENKGLIKKIKKGRANYVVLIDSNE